MKFLAVALMSLAAVACWPAEDAQAQCFGNGRVLVLNNGFNGGFSSNSVFVDNGFNRNFVILRNRPQVIVRQQPQFVFQNGFSSGSSVFVDRGLFRNNVAVRAPGVNVDVNRRGFFFPRNRVRVNVGGF